jgi:lipopolysaccharide biosynthesis protein
MSDDNIGPTPERMPNPLRWVIYSTFDPIGAMQQFALDQVIAYRAAGAFVLVVDTSPQLSAERARGWDEYASAWFQRKNEGYDIMSYSAGLRWIENRMSTSSYSIVLTNDSCYGPFISIKCIFSRIEKENNRKNIVFGITDSYETDYHLQSYFLYFPDGTKEILSQFFGSLGKTTNREDAILNGEVALSRFLRAEHTNASSLSHIFVEAQSIVCSLCSDSRVDYAQVHKKIQI